MSVALFSENDKCSWSKMHSVHVPWALAMGKLLSCILRVRGDREGTAACPGSCTGYVRDKTHNQTGVGLHTVTH